MYDDIRPLKGNETKFYDYLKKIEDTYTGKNNDWIKPILKDWKQYVSWCLCFIKDEIIAFSAIQKHYMPEDTVRLLTRTWIDESHRHTKIRKTGITPNSNMLKFQLNCNEILGFKKAIITLEPNRSYNAITYICEKFNYNIGCNFIPQKDKIKTWPTAKPEQYQWYAIMDL